jgi:hypothetical protein
MHRGLAAVCLGLSLILSGCLSYILGTKVNQPLEGQEGYYSRTFTCSYQDAFVHIQNILDEMGVSIYHQSQEEGIISAQGFNAVFKQCATNTEVGIFFKSIDTLTTRISIACGNVYLAKFAADEIYRRLDEKLSPPSESWQIINVE